MQTRGPHRALAYVHGDRWWLIVAPLAEVSATISGDAESAPVCFVTYRDLGPAENDFAPVSFGHRLIESGFIIDPAERQNPSTVAGWVPTGIPDQWRTVCYPTSEAVG